jgi:lipoyl(octanoyl) transferase
VTDRAPESRGAHELWIVDLGRMPYADALELQRSAARSRIEATIPEDLLLLVEHPPVVTLGRTAKAGHVVAAPEYLRDHGVELFEVERGGDVTFHGPGQLVGYPIIDLKRHRTDLHWYLRSVEEGLIRGLDELGIRADRHPGFTGVWTNGRKIASIGVHARDWVTWHGFALNVNTDLSYFDLIVPCGIQGVVMTSVVQELGPPPPSLADVGAVMGRAFAGVFSLHPRAIALDRLAIRAEGAAP